MTDSPFVYPVAAHPPRHFWRRAIALVIDVLVFNIVLFAMALPLQAITGWNLGFSLAQSTNCEIATNSPLIQQVETEWPLAKGEVRQNLICVVSDLMFQQRIFVSSVANEANGKSFNRSVWIPIDESGNAAVLNNSWVNFVSSGPILGLLSVALFLFGTAKITAIGKRTPGKSLMSLRIVDNAANVPSLKKAVTREVWKFLPIIVTEVAIIIAGGTSLLGISSHSSGEFIDLIRAARDTPPPEFGSLRIGLLAVFAVFLWWFGPFFRWRGKSSYDHIAGCLVIRSKAVSA